MRKFSGLFLLSVILMLVMLSPVTGQEDEVTSGILEVGNGFYKVFVDATTGQYTASTDVQHSAGPGLSVLYAADGHLPETSFNTIRSYTSNTDYVQGDRALSIQGFERMLLRQFTPRSRVIEGNGIRTRYVLNPTAEGSRARDAMEIVQDIRVTGTTQRDSAVQVTTRITNMGESPLKVGVRYLWDFKIGLDDGPGFSTQNPASENIGEEVEFFAPSFGYFQIQDNDMNASSPILSVFGTVNMPGSFNPPATRPSLLRNACWEDASETAFEYTINPLRDINTVNADCFGDRGGDGAVIYYFGHDEQTAYEIKAAETVTISTYIIATPPASTDALDSDGAGALDSWQSFGFDAALIVNGDFEVIGDVDAKGFVRVADNSSLQGWVLVDGDVEAVSAEIWQPASGQWSLDLSGSSAGAIQQNIATEIGQTYELRFAFSGYPAPTPRVKTMRVEISGQPESSVFSVDSSSFMPEDMNWEYKTIVFTAVDTTTAITFRSEVQTNTGPLIDDVSITLVPGETAVGDCITDIVYAYDLSDAILAANAGTGCANIRLNADIPLGELLPPYPGEFGDNAFPIVTSTITIDGNGFTISRVNASSDFRFFEVNGRDGNQGNLTLKNMYLSGGNLLDSGAVLVDGSRGGSASINIDNVTFAGNRSNGNGGALTLFGFDGGQSNAVITNSAFRDNHGTYGGAIYIGGFDNGNSTTYITNTSFDLNSSIDSGGAIYNNGQGGGGHVHLTIEDSSFSGNQAGGTGGAIINMARRNGNAVLNITQSRFLDNVGRLGSAISNDASENGVAQLTLDGIDATGTDITCFSSDASGAVVRDETCGA